MRSRFSSQTGKEAYDEAQQDFTNQNAQSTTGGGDITDTATNPVFLTTPSAGTYETATGMTTAQAEALGDNSSTNTFIEIQFLNRKAYCYC